MIEKAPLIDPQHILSNIKNLDVEIFKKIPDYNKIEEEYRYWDKVKYYNPKGLKKSDQINHAAEVWGLIKAKRYYGKRNYRLGTEEYPLRYNFNINNFLSQKLHYLDFNFGAGIQKEQLLSELDKQKYLTNAIMEESIFSSMIEGATTTRVKAKDMLRKDKKPKNKSEQMILNNYRTIQYISHYKNEDISLEKLFEIHRLVTENTLEKENIGIFRNNNEIHVMNEITGEIVHTPPKHEHLNELMKSFCVFFNNDNTKNFIHPIVKASILHFLIGYIHPFVDGNGRTARAIFYWYLLKNGYWLTEYMSISRVIMKTKTQYEKAYLYTEIDDMDVTYFIHYQVKVLIQAFEDLKTYVAKKKKEENKHSKYLKIKNINERQAQILFWIEENENRFFTVKEIENIYGITNQTARTDLEELVEKEYLKKIAVNKKSSNYWKGKKFDSLK